MKATYEKKENNFAELRVTVDGDQWKEAQKKNSVLFETLTAYVSQERSVSATAKELFVHKNTLLYRLNQIYAYIPKEEFDSPYCRDYIRLSIYYLTEQVLNEHK